ncbi:hypothetical protein BGZ80_011202 [Entomortierella chlamydospora]|uniref:Serine protease n=1 Tax=Entomortierella chlamydospora TaxID=101097 RepID=A0A9P6SZB5_9FUNG|nr:hypothetical protein BGZ79_002000 [Entomortierella chlamydospora]KAG0013255.1 hypothetical protein BGZ80_011202 [Entomortierella chlamydospora]
MRPTSITLLSTALLLLAVTNSSQRLAGVANAQVSVPGSFSANFAGSLYHDIPHGVTIENLDVIDFSKIQGAPPVLQLPHIDNAQLLNEERLQRDELVAQGMEPDGVYQFGKAVSIESFDMDSTLSRGRWVPLSVLRQQVSGQKSYIPSRDYEDDVVVWQLEVHSKSALSLNLIFSDFHLPAGTEFYVSGKKKTLGAFTPEINNKPDGVFATAPLAGDRLLLEFYTPKALLEQGIMPRIQLGHIIHGYKPTLLASSSDITAKGIRQQDGSIAPRRRMAGLRDQTRRDFLGVWRTFSQSDDDDDEPIRAMSGKCNVDVACHQSEYYEQSRSVGVILTDFNQKYCTGSLVNNVRQDGRQLFLTANHCAGFADTSAHIVMFNHEKVQCGSTSEVVNEHDTAMGLIKLANYDQSDFTLYEIVEPIPDSYNLYLSGWSALLNPPSSRIRNLPSSSSSFTEESEETISSPWRSPRSSIKENPSPAPEGPPRDQIPVVGIHHPSGDTKKISFFYNGSLPRSCWSECITDDYFHWQIPRWDLGTTEPGSSGSPLFDADKRIVGQLHGGSASCWNKNGYDMYGAVHASFSAPPKKKNKLSTYLDPDETGAKFMDGNSLASARRDTRRREQRREEEESEQYVPLGRIGLEKPLIETKVENPCHSSSGHDQSERMSGVFNRAWQRLTSRYSNLEEY